MANTAKSTTNLDSLYEVQTNIEANILAKQSVKINQAKSNEILFTQISLTDHLSVYPNPATDILNVSYTSNLDGEFILFDAVGHVIIKSTLNRNNTKATISISELCTGVYSYKIILDGFNYVGKLNIVK
jgi:hypothetical protein